MLFAFYVKRINAFDPELYTLLRFFAKIAAKTTPQTPYTTQTIAIKPLQVALRCVGTISRMEVATIFGRANARQ